VRIIAGTARGRRLKAPRDQSIRPTADRVRQSIFDALGQSMNGESVLDLFAGTGALALEAVSRGAERAVMVDQSPEACQLCLDNAEVLGFGDRVKVLRSNIDPAIGQLAGQGARFTLVFADPPYAQKVCKPLLELLENSTILAPGARLMIEHSRREAAPDGVGSLVCQDSRRFGDTMASFYAKRMDI
jgi:16S rRNA (guanine966-N2)-methyltransferase